MAKRRTRKQKEGAKHQFKIGRDQLEKIASSGKDVKSQIRFKSKTLKPKVSTFKKAKDKAKPGYLASIKREIGRSLFLASLILSLELVIYLIWR